MAKYEGSANDQDLIDALKMARCFKSDNDANEKDKIVPTNSPKK